MKRLRSAFTIIEVLIATVMLSGAFIYTLRIHTENSEHILYLSERNKHSLQDSLYLSPNILRYHKDTKTAYQLLERHFKIKEDSSRKILKDSNRSIYIPAEIRIYPPPNKPGVTALVHEVKLKNQHSASYWHFKVIAF